MSVCAIFKTGPCICLTLSLVSGLEAPGQSTVCQYFIKINQTFPPIPKKYYTGFQNTDTCELVIAMVHWPARPWFPLLPEASNRDQDLISVRVGRQAQGQTVSP